MYQNTLFAQFSLDNPTENFCARNYIDCLSKFSKTRLWRLYCNKPRQAKILTYCLRAASERFLYSHSDHDHWVMRFIYSVLTHTHTHTYTQAQGMTLCSQKKSTYWASRKALLLFEKAKLLDGKRCLIAKLENTKSRNMSYL